MFDRKRLGAHVKRQIETARAGERGQGMLEYSLILVLVSIAAIAVMGGLGLQISTFIQAVVDAFPP